MSSFRTLWKVLDLKRFFKQFMEKIQLLIYFLERSSPGHMRRYCCYFLVDIALQMTLIKYLLSETTGGIDEKVTGETRRLKFSNAKVLTTDAAHTPIAPAFLLLFDVLVCFFFWRI